MSDPEGGNLPRPLDGVTVLDVSRLLPGPFASQLLADFGPLGSVEATYA